ncbi:ASCH domain-containing protein [Dechloromonas denitrificans]|uniref:ASCH domain-containing protein n=1 Tax=Dechloromonas denitrificans TaxID=281362 RepID=UPI001CF8B92B|nr:ASCH domain-containing protein [Dechloromonas denitrificans]UCV02338.1 ASCH domain-containing protein [Dechloromonas denitrificans]
MIALSIRQPWAWLIVAGYKDIENRDWKTPFRGRCLIHASKGGTRAEWEEAIEFMRECLPTHPVLPTVADFDKFARGGVLGAVDIVDCVDRSDSRWFVGDYGFLLRNPTPMPFVPVKGRLGFFDIPGVQP